MSIVAVNSGPTESLAPLPAVVMDVVFWVYTGPVFEGYLLWCLYIPAHKCNKLQNHACFYSVPVDELAIIYVHAYMGNRRSLNRLIWLRHDMKTLLHYRPFVGDSCEYYKSSYYVAFMQPN